MKGPAMGTLIWMQAIFHNLQPLEQINTCWLLFTRQNSSFKGDELAYHNAMRMIYQVSFCLDCAAQDYTDAGVFKSLTDGTCA